MNSEDFPDGEIKQWSGYQPQDSGRGPDDGQRRAEQPEHDTEHDLQEPDVDERRDVHPGGHAGEGGQQLLQGSGRLAGDRDPASLRDNRRDRDPKRRYRLWYTPFLDFDLVTDLKPKLWTGGEQEAYSDEVKAMAEELDGPEGLRNPVIANLGPRGRLDVHPGKIRMAAAKSLDWKGIPAIIVGGDRIGPLDKEWVEIEPEEVPEYLDSDFAVDVSWRFCAIYRVQ